MFAGVVPYCLKNPFPTVNPKKKILPTERTQWNTVHQGVQKYTKEGGYIRCTIRNFLDCVVESGRNKLNLNYVKFDRLKNPSNGITQKFAILRVD